MAVRRWDPFRDLLTIQNEMNRLFGRTYGPGESAEAETPGTWVPALDVDETRDRCIISAEPAGMTTDDIVLALPQGSDTTRIEASMSDGLLTIEVAKAAQAQPVRVEVKARG